jgi:hypothetical protein
MYTNLAFWPFIPSLNHAINSSDEQRIGFIFMLLD